MNESYSQASASSFSQRSQPFAKHKERVKRSKGLLSDNSSQQSDQLSQKQLSQKAGQEKQLSVKNQWDAVDQDDWKLPPGQQQTPNLSVDYTKRKEDLSLGQLINNTTLQIENQTFNQSPGQELPLNHIQQDAQSMRSGVSSKHSGKGGQVRASDIYDQFKEIRRGLEKLGQAKDWAQAKGVDVLSDQDQTPVNEQPSMLQQKYQKLMRTITEEDKEPPTTLILTYQEQMHFINQQYMVTKRREFNQLNMDTTADLKSVNQSSMSNSTLHKRLEMGAQHKDGEESEQSVEYTNIDVKLITDESRFKVAIPKSYENHYRQYFENPDGFQQNQKLKEFEKHQFKQRLRQRSLADLEKQFAQLASGLTQCQRIDLIGSILPEFAHCLSELQQARLALYILIDRIKQFGGVQFKQSLMADESLSHFSALKAAHFKHGLLNPVQLASAQLGRRPSRIGTSKEQQEAKRLVSEESNREIQKIKDQLGITESKLKDVQLGRLQEKVKGFAQTERQLRSQIQEIEKKDEKLLDKIEKGVCFGKVMFTTKALSVKSVKQWCKVIQRDFNRKLMSTESNRSHSSDGGGSPQAQAQNIMGKLDSVIEGALEEEFNELFRELSNYQVQLEYRFALLTDDHFTLYKDLYMEQESISFALNTLDVIDLGLVVQNNKVKKRLYFFKVVHYNAAAKTRDVYLMSVQEDQLAKWCMVLEPDEEVRSLDRSFMFVKEKVMRQRVTAAQMEQMDIQSDGESSGNSNVQNQQSLDPYMDASRMDQLIMEIKKKRGKRDESRDSQIQQRFVDEVSLEKMINAGSSRQRQANQQEAQRRMTMAGVVQTLTAGMGSAPSLDIQQLIEEEEKETKGNKKKKRDRKKQKIIEEYSKAYTELQLGTIFLKYGRKGDPKFVHVFLIDKKICWKKPGSTEKPRHIMVKDIIEVVTVRESRNFLRFPKVPDVERACSFTLHTKSRTLDLVAPNLTTKRTFLENLNMIRRLQDQKLFKKQKFAQIDVSKILNATDLEDNEYFTDILDKINAYYNQRDQATRKVGESSPEEGEEEEYDDEEAPEEDGDYDDEEDGEEVMERVHLMQFQSQEHSAEKSNPGFKSTSSGKTAPAADKSHHISHRPLNSSSIHKSYHSAAIVASQHQPSHHQEVVEESGEESREEDEGFEEEAEEESFEEEEEEKEMSSWKQEEIVNDFSK